VQTRDQDETTGSRWKEDQVLTIIRCLKVDGKDKPPKKLLTTCMATMRDARALGRLARLEAEKRGIRQAVEVIGIHDGVHGIDPLWPGHFGCHQRILEDDHAAEHLHEVARAAPPSDEKAARRLADGLGDHRIGREAVGQAGQGQGGVLERARGGGDSGPAEPMAQRGRGVPTLLVGVAPSAGGRINGHAPHARQGQFM